MGQIAVLTRGLWRLRQEIAVLTGLVPVRWQALSRPEFEAVAGWGHAPTADRARRLAARSGVPYLAFEDGPLRSIRPGPAEPPMSLVVDRLGIYYRAAEPSDLVRIVADADWFTPELRSRAADAAALLARLKLSKYNSGRERRTDELGLALHATSRVLVLDQVRGDASIAGALADADSFRTMLAAAIDENPTAEIVVKVHPDVLSGRRAGYFGELWRRERLTLVAEEVNPWSLLEAVDRVYTVSSGLGFEAAVAGKDVVTFGTPFYAGWGFTDDRSLRVERPLRVGPLQLFAAYYLRYAHYFDAYARHQITFEEAAEQLASIRERFLAQRGRPVCYRITRWKRSTVARMLDGPDGGPIHAADPLAAVRLARQHGGSIVAWASRDNGRLEAECTKAGVALTRVEDGFIRSAGLGASFVQPLSLVFDSRGIFYDSSRPSDLELMLEQADFPSDLIDRARRLRERLVALGTTKYNVAAADAGAWDQVRQEAGWRPVVLVPGQVEDDASIQRGSPALKHNVELLQAARVRHPESYVIYKPHPDVEAGFRRGRVPEPVAREYADRVLVRAPILALIDIADRIETMTSLTGFEALLRGKAVTTHGQPFYAGWGLTEDLFPVARRTRQRSLDELVAAALILYPRYLDPVSGRVCGPELLVERLASEGQRQKSLTERVVRLAQISAARALHLRSSVKLFARRGA